jgi:predicted TIM-barrel enzyme
MIEREFAKLFAVKKPIIGMIHLAGGRHERISRALEELAIYEAEGVDGAIVEDYHGTSDDVKEALTQARGRFNRLVLGVNVLRNPYQGFEIADAFGARFVQFDSVQTRDLKPELYDIMRTGYPAITVLGGVGFKYIPPTGNPLGVDLAEARLRCEAIVTTGEGTGKETPLGKLLQYRRELLGNFPLIVGAGINLQNVETQLSIVDGAIVGSYFKPEGDTQKKVDRNRVKDLMNVVRKIRTQR